MLAEQRKQTSYAAISAAANVKTAYNTGQILDYTKEIAAYSADIAQSNRVIAANTAAIAETNAAIAANTARTAHNTQAIRDEYVDRFH